MPVTPTIEYEPEAVAAPQPVSAASLNQSRFKPTDWAKLTIIIPAFNEATALRSTLKKLLPAFPDAEIVVVDDGSSDDTAAIARSFAGVRVLSHGRNRGYGAALKTGVHNTTRPCIAWYDADGQHRPQDLAAVARPVIEQQRDVVIGVRGPDSARQRDRATGKVVLNWVARLVSGEKLPDLNSGLRCFRREALAAYLHLLPDGFSASTTSTLVTLKRGYRLGYAPIVAQPRIGTSTVKIFSDGIRSLQLIVRIIVLFEAFRVFTTLSALLFIPAMIYGTVLAFICGEGFPTLAGTVVVASVLTFFMGIIADQVVELRKERFEDVVLAQPRTDDRAETPDSPDQQGQRAGATDATGQ
ncbi:MAG: glycosyltransferase family 2 protein [Planctomycetota bacterium]